MLPERSAAQVLLKLAAVCALCISCTDEKIVSIEVEEIPPVGNPGTAERFMPLSLGQTWTYGYVDTLLTLQPERVRIDSVVEEESDRFLVRTKFLYYEPDYVRVDFDSDARYRYADSSVVRESGSETSWAPKIEVPASRGDIWHGVNTSWGGSYAEVIATDTTIQTPAGTFQGVLAIREYNCSDTRPCPSATTTYYAPGIGPVKFEPWEWYFNENPTGNSYVLLSTGN